MTERWFRDKDIKYIWAKVVEQGPDGWCKVTFAPSLSKTVYYNYHINYLNAFYNEYVHSGDKLILKDTQEVATGGDTPQF